MKFGSKGVSNMIFAVSIVVLVVIASVGFGLYASQQASPMATVTTTMGNNMVETMAQTTSSAGMAETGMVNNVSFVGSFQPQSGAMISNGWLVVASLGKGEYAVTIHAEGLEPNGDYIVEGPLTTGTMQVVPISTASMGMNTTAASEFTASSQGTGLYWIVLNSNPTHAFEAIQLYYLPGMSMQNSTLIATVRFSMMSS